MKNKPKKIYNCGCGCDRQTVTFHELIPGSANRTICEDHNIQLPLCVDCHTVAHLRPLLSGYSPLQEFVKEGSDALNNIAIQEHLFSILGVDMYEAWRAFSPSRSKKYLVEMKDICAESIKRFEIC